VTWLARRAAIAIALLATIPEIGSAQDTAATVRHVLPIDLGRLQPQNRVYDMVVHMRDSSAVIGQREISFNPAIYGGNSAWLLVETRTGLVPAAETLWVTPELRPLLWFSVVGDSRLGATFKGDTIFGAVSSPAGKRTIVLTGRPDLLVSQAMIEVLLPMLPLGPAWMDSATALVVDMAGAVMLPSDLSVIGEEEVAGESSRARPSWVVAVRAEGKTLIFWVDKEYGDVHRVQQSLASHVGSLLEFRRRSGVPPGQ
jgi:hypothetical protein